MTEGSISPQPPCCAVLSMVTEGSLRSVYVGNIPYEATEEKLKDIFGQAGQVVTFTLVYNRETGRPKGYGFCEYRDQDTALSARRNLNGVEIAGRRLRVDNAYTEKTRMEIQSLMAETVMENPFGAPCEPGRAPEVVSEAVASLPPEQMFRLMQQMKMCIQNNPHEARTMLLQNPQLAYALLQAQVVMNIVDPETAVTMLHKTPAPVPPLGVAGGYGNSGSPGGVTPSGAVPQLPHHLAGTDPEKAQLIMQVLQLTDAQITVLPAEQRTNLMMLRDQLLCYSGPIIQ